MKYQIKYTNAFKKNRKLMIKRGYDLSLLNEVIYIISNGKVLPFKYHVHQLKGSYDGYFECHIKPDWLLIYYIDDIFLILTLINTGSHSNIL